MFKLENRPRSMSTTSREKCVHPGLRPVSVTDAEQLLRSLAPLTEEEDEDEFIRAVLPTPRTPEEAIRCAKLQDMTSKFHLSDAHLLHIEKRMLDEVNRGLNRATNPSANVKCYVTYVTRLPTGREEGQFLALDLGGTNFRVILAELHAGSRSVRMKCHKHEVSEALMLGPGRDLFDFMADCLLNFMIEHDLLGSHYRLGFTFSFPTSQRALDKAELTTWTKGFRCDNVVGVDVVTLLQEAIARKPQLDIRVDAILNDTTGCLIACAYKRPDCAIGVILGTGTNASYLESPDLVDMWDSDSAGTERPKKHSPGVDGVVINTEWGAFGNTGSLDIVRTSYDHQLDAQSLNPGKQVYEKLISGMYLGELTRLVLLDVIEQGILFNGQIMSKKLTEKGAFPTWFVSQIESDPDRNTFDEMDNVLRELGFDLNKVTNFDRGVIRYICECVSVRASGLAGAGVASLVNKIGRRRITVGMDGSLYKFHPHLSRRLKRVARRLVCDCILFDLVLAEDGSGRGAALAVAALDNK